MIGIKTPSEIVKMRDVCHIVRDALLMIESFVRPGITTRELDAKIEEFIRKAGAEPSFKNYNGFPASACISIDEVVVHGIPGDRELKEGEIVSVDVGANLKGFHGDAARTFAVGAISEEKSRLIEVTKQSFFEGIKNAREGRRLGDVSHAIQVYCESRGYGVVREMAGHGIGRRLHEDPIIPNYGSAGSGVGLKKGYTLAIEPMITLGNPAIKINRYDGWTCSTMDGKPSAHYENTILITADEPEILTL